MYDLKLQQIQLLKEKLQLLEEKYCYGGKAVNQFKFEDFAFHNPFPVIRINEDGIIIISNQAANDYFQQETLRGKKWNKLVQVEPNSIQVIDGDLQHEFKINGRTLLLCYRNVSEKGFINIYAFDISHQREVEKELELEKARHMHSAKMASLGEMAGGMAHELNTPLGLMALSINQIQKSYELGKLNILVDVLSDMDDAVKRMAKLISGFKTFSRDDRKGEFAFVSFRKLLEETFAICRMGLKGTNVEFLVPTVIPDIQIECNPSEFSQVLINLVHNARDAVEDMIKPWIKIEIEVQSELFVRVTDSGHGIPEEKQDNIFIPFFTTKEVGKGTGLGLSIIKDIIKTHQGELKLRPECENTCFEFQIPLIQSAGELL